MLTERHKAVPILGLNLGCLGENQESYLLDHMGPVLYKHCTLCGNP